MGGIDMPIYNLKDDVSPIKVTNVYETILDNFNEQIEREEKKYPLSDREKIFVETIRNLLDRLDCSARRW